MAVVLCSINNRAAHRGMVYAMTLKPMGQLPQVECLRPTVELVYGLKYQGDVWESYVDGYRALLTERWTQVRTWLKCQIGRAHV